MSISLLLPKGRIFDNISRLFSESGKQVEMIERSYRPLCADSEISLKLMKPQNISAIVELGSHDAGFTGRDWIAETAADVEIVCDTGFDPVAIIAACPTVLAQSDLRTRTLVVATEYERLARQFLDGRGYQYRLLKTFGATEVFPPDDADMIVDNTATGRTLAENGLTVIGEIMRSSTCFIANKEAMKDPEKREKILELATLFGSVLEARKRVLIEMNVSEEIFPRVIASLPCMQSPTVSPLYGNKGYAVKIAVLKTDAAFVITGLKKMGATDILEYDMRKVLL